MSPSRIRAGVLALLGCLAAAMPAHAQWRLNGVPLGGTAHFGTANPIVISDGGTGTYVVYLGSGGTFAQHLDEGGTPLWPGQGALTGMSVEQAIPDGAGGFITVNGTTVQRFNSAGTRLWGTSGVTGSGGQALVSDGSGGAITVAAAGAPTDIVAHRVDASGTPLWTTTVCNAPNAQGIPVVAPDGAGGVLITWSDQRTTTFDDLYAQRVSGAGVPLWTANGVAVAVAARYQFPGGILSDGAGGAFLTWFDSRSNEQDVYHQHLDATGAALWGADGAVLCGAPADQTRPQMVSDGAGGFIAGWEDRRANGAAYYGDYYVQRVNGSGVSLWTAGGVAATASLSIVDASDRLTADGAGGVVIAWTDYRGLDSDVYAQRVDATGAVRWGASGVAVCSIPYNQQAPSVTADGAGGAVVVWNDTRSSNQNTLYDSYALRVLADGTPGWLPNIRGTLTSVSDVPADEGGAVRLSLIAAPFDISVFEPRVVGYNVWRRASPPAAAAAAMTRAHAIALAAAAPKEAVLVPEAAAAIGFPPGAWQSLGYTAAARQPSYTLIAATRADSGAAGTGREAYVVTIHTDQPDVIAITAADSGYSVDNLAPGPPAMLAGTRTADTEAHLYWSPSPEADLWHYRVYRGNSPSFVPSPANRIGEPTAAAWDDAGFAEGITHYKVTAIDRHGLESAAALLAPGAITDAGAGPVPAVSFLTLAGPNPFHDVTAIEYGLRRAGHVRLAVYDVGGREVRRLVDGDQAAGIHDLAWSGEDRAGRPVRAGVYLLRIEGPELQRTLRLVRAR